MNKAFFFLLTSQVGLCHLSPVNGDWSCPFSHTCIGSPFKAGQSLVWNKDIPSQAYTIQSRHHVDPDSDGTYSVCGHFTAGVAFSLNQGGIQSNNGVFSMDRTPALDDWVTIETRVTASQVEISVWQREAALLKRISLRRPMATTTGDSRVGVWCDGVRKTRVADFSVVEARVPLSHARKLQASNNICQMHSKTFAAQGWVYNEAGTNVDCWAVFRADVGKVVELWFNGRDGRSNPKKFIYIYDGQSTSAPLWARTGGFVNERYFSTGRYLTFRWKVEGVGLGHAWTFQLHQSKPATICELASNSATQTAVGTARSYPYNNADCSITIQAPNTTCTVLLYLVGSAAFGKDFVTIYNGPTTSAQQLFRSSPTNFKVGWASSASSLTLRWQTSADSPVTSHSWVASWRFQGSLQCGNFKSYAPTTARPTSLPSRMPTGIPSALPTDVPTSMPSRAPTKVPTALPTAAPTGVPSMMPSSVPTSGPTAIPTMLPTGLPSGSPTTLPSHPPTATPTSPPSVTPTKSPSLKRCYAPSDCYTWPGRMCTSGYIPSNAQTLFDCQAACLGNPLCTFGIAWSESAKQCDLLRCCEDHISETEYTVYTRWCFGRSSACSVGRYQRDTCIDCPAGRYQSSIGFRSCLLCGAGRYSTNAASECTKCSNGTYQSAQGQGQCLQCPTGMVSSTNGAACEWPPTFIEFPTTAPTVEPTSYPTMLPTRSPTGQPSYLPTSVPTQLPTLLPTLVPTALPTPLPTAAPSAPPTPVPSAAPTTAPTRADIFKCDFTPSNRCASFLTLSGWPARKPGFASNSSATPSFYYLFLTPDVSAVSGLVTFTWPTQTAQSWRLSFKMFVHTTSSRPAGDGMAVHVGTPFREYGQWTAWESQLHGAFAWQYRTFFGQSCVTTKLGS